MNTSQNPVTTALPTSRQNGKIVSAREAVRLIRDGTPSPPAASSARLS